MLILDESYTGAILRQAAQDAYVYHAIDRKDLYRDPTTAKLLMRGLNSNLRQEVLWDLLLFYPAVCSPFDNLDVSPLVAEGLVESDNRIINHSKHRSALKKNPESVLMFDRYITYEFRSSLGQGKIFRDLNEYLDFENNLRSSVKAEDTIFRSFDDYESFLDFVNTFDIVGLGLPGVRKNSSSSSESFSERVASEMTRERFKNFKEVEERLYLAECITEAAVKWFAVTDAAVRNSAVVKARAPRVRGGHPAEVPLAKAGASKSVVEIWLSEVTTLPRLSGIEDVLRLRADPRINDFKDVLLAWCDRLSAGDVSSEEKLRMEIRKANKELSRLEKVKRVAGWSAVVSVPLDVAILLSGITLPTSLVGLGFYLYEKRKERSFDWVMFGR